MLQLFITGIFIDFVTTNHHIKFEAVMVCIREVMAIQTHGISVSLWVGRANEIRANVCNNKIKYM